MLKHVLPYLFCFSLVLTGCDSKQKSADQIKIREEFSAYISGFTSGLVERNSKIIIQLNKELNNGLEVGQVILDPILTFTPEIDGQLILQDKSTLAFIPEHYLPSGTQYKATLALDELMEVPKEMESFVFSFQTLAQHLNLSFDGLSPYMDADISRNKLSGVLRSSNIMTAQERKDAFEVSAIDKVLEIEWLEPNNSKEYPFVIQDIVRGDETYHINFRLRDENIGKLDQSNVRFRVPATDEFSILNVKVDQSKNSRVTIEFSDPLEKNQDLRGLISLGGSSEKLRMVIRGNQVQIYPRKKVFGSKELSISSGIINTEGDRLNKNTLLNLVFEMPKPELRLMGKGTIMPNSEGLILPFRAIGLQSVGIRIVKIYRENIGFFLQNNQLGGEQSIKQVARPVYRKTLPLTDASGVDPSKWSNYKVDLEKLISVEPGAIYQVELTFSRNDAVYVCPEEETVSSFSEEGLDDDSWNDSGYYYDYYPEGYTWRERDNPCHVSYYMRNRFVRKNIFASNIGLIAKGNEAHEYMITSSNLLTTDPEANTSIEIYNYQNQIIGTGTTNSDGMAKIKVPYQPYYAKAKKGDEFAYLRLDNGSSLSLSSFDIGGSKIEEGINGMLYGERGVWRPGDTLHLVFAKYDQFNRYPENQPVRFELINPLGQQVYSRVNTTPVGDLYDFKCKTTEDDITGYYTAKVSIGNAEFTKSIRIETVKPNRLKINWLADREVFTVEHKKVTGNLDVNWLHGALGSNMKTEFDVSYHGIQPPFEGVKGYNFLDPLKTKNDFKDSKYTAKTDAKGKVKTVFELPDLDGAPGLMRLQIKTRAYESGGNFSVNSFSSLYAPFTSLTGLKLPEMDKNRPVLDTDKKHILQLASISPDGTPLNRKLKYTLYKLSWSWWWSSSHNREGRYIRDEIRSTYKTGNVNTVNGKAELPISVGKHDWGRYYLEVTDVKSGHTTGSICYFDWPDWWNRGGNQGDGAVQLSFNSDKSSYRVGETATLTIPGSIGARALVAIESGTQVISQDWVELIGDFTPFRFEISEEMAPNVYAHVTLIQPHASTENDRPIRMYGLIPISVEDPKTHLEPLLDMTDELEPEKNFEVEVSEKSGRSMAYTLAVVDEGLLDLTRFKTPDLHNYFYAKQALGIKTWDMYNYVIGAYGARLENAFAIGGGEDLNAKANPKANRFKPAIRFYGPYYLSDNEKNKHKLYLENYVGSVRVMLVSAENGAFGKVEKTVPVTKPLMVSTTLPRVLGTDESFKLPVTVFAMKPNVKDVKLTLKTNALLKVDNPTQTVHFDQVGEQTIYFDAKVSSGIGVGEVEVSAKSGANTASEKLEIAVRAANSVSNRTTKFILKPGESIEKSLMAYGMKGLRKGKLELSAIPSLNLAERLDYLIRYPHGCIEQTTSAVFPQLYLSGLMQLTDAEKEAIEAHIKTAIVQLGKFQIPAGGFSYWPGGEQANSWGTSYAGHFLIEAQKKGYDIPADMLSRWLSFQKREANQWTDSYSYSRNDFAQAYRLYTLALAGEGQMGPMNRLKEKKSISTQARIRLASSYALLGQDVVANNLFHSAKSDEKSLPYYWNYGSPDRDLAMALETATLGKIDEKAHEYFMDLSKAFGSASWMSTQTTAYGLLAISQYLAVYPPAKKINVTAYWNNQALFENNGGLVRSQDLSIQDSNELKIQNSSDGTVYLQLLEQGVPAAGEEKGVKGKLDLSIKYLDANNKSVNLGVLPHGSDLNVAVTIKNTDQLRTIRDIALSNLFPSGFEILGMDMDNSGSFDYQDIRDDRIFTYFELKPGAQKEFIFRVNASYRGKFYLPMQSVEAMYDNSYSGQIKGQWITIE